MLGNGVAEEVPGQSDWCIWWRKIGEWLYEQVHGVTSIILTWVEQPVLYNCELQDLSSSLATIVIDTHKPNTTLSSYV